MSCAEERRGRRLRGLLPKSLSWRLALWSAASSMLVVFAVSMVMYLALADETRSIDEQVLIKRAIRIQEVMQTVQSVEEWLGHEVSEDNEGPRQVFMRVLDESGRIVAETPTMSERAAPQLFPAPGAPDARAHAVRFTAGDGSIFRGLAVRIPAHAFGSEGEAVVQAAVDTSLDEALLSRYQVTLAVIFAFALVLCAAAGGAVAAYMLRPLRRMAREAEAIDGRLAGVRLSLAGGAGDELGEVGRAFNDVLERLEHANHGLKRYADDVAHEIRTPLNRMLMNAEIALREPRSEPEYKEAIETHIQECSALTRLAERLLFVARAENGRLGLERAELDVRRELEIIRQFYVTAAEEAGVALRLDETAPGLRMCADRTLFQQAVGNVVANAIEHTRAGGMVRIAARRSGNGVEIAVTDTGCGVSEADLPTVFDRFYRADPARGGGHVGLGLAIVKSIAELHGGSVGMRSKVGEGTCATLWWPD